MILAAIWNPKGGQGKTTLSLNLAAAGAKLGLNVLVISADIQDDDMTEIGQGGRYTFDIVKKMPVEKPEYDLVLVDHPAQDFNCPAAHRVVCPIVPCKVDFKVYAQARPVLEEAGKDIIEVVNRGDVRVKEEKEFMTLMRKRGATCVKARAVFGKAHNDNRTIFDSAYTKYPKIQEPRADIEHLLARVLA